MRRSSFRVYPTDTKARLVDAVRRHRCTAVAQLSAEQKRHPVNPTTGGLRDVTAPAFDTARRGLGFHSGSFSEFSDETKLS